ncbi:MAG TPA: formate--tetrahydrofolate ligase [Candidatus Obscuribacterales bacterium]
MKTDLEIARSATLRPMLDIANDIGLTEADIEMFGGHKAKVTFQATERILSDSRLKRGKLVVVTAITPTKAGEGKTTFSIGIAQALWKLGVKSVAALREPSLGPVFGMKGGGTGGGFAQLVPMEDINLHFTGDIHAVTSSNNLLAALLDNHVFYGNVLKLDARTINYRRVIDMNDRALRDIVQGLGGKANGFPRQSGFQITAASEVMAILCLADSIADLKTRLGNIVVGQDDHGQPVRAAQLDAVGSMAVLLKDALRPNLVQTLEGTPAFVHGGPFGNIAHGCSSVLATRLALRLGEVVTTECGFGADLGFEKFCDIVAAPRMDELKPDAAVIVCTVRALKMHGGVAYENLGQANVEAVRKGLANLDRHAQIVSFTGIPFVVAINRFTTDTEEELRAILDHCRAKNWLVAVGDVWGAGGEGGRAIADMLMDRLKAPSPFQPFYGNPSTAMEKLYSLAKNVYGAADIELGPEARRQLKWLNTHGFGELPVCVAKTQYSLTDDPTAIGAPTGFKMHIRNFQLSAGAGFLVALMGDIMTMPGLPKSPAAAHMDLEADGSIKGLA